MEEMRGGGDDLGGGLAEVFAEFAPERVEHEFGRGFPGRGSFDEALGIEVEVDVEVEVEVEVAGSLGRTAVVARECGPNSGSQADSCLILSQVLTYLAKSPVRCLRFGKMPDFVDHQNSVPLFHGLDEFGGAPGPAQGALVGGVGAAMTSLEERFWYLGLDALGAEGKGDDGAARDGRVRREGGCPPWPIQSTSRCRCGLGRSGSRDVRRGRSASC